MAYLREDFDGRWCIALTSALDPERIIGGMGPKGETLSESLLDAIFAYDDGSMFLAVAEYERVIPRQMMA